MIYIMLHLLFILNYIFINKREIYMFCTCKVNYATCRNYTFLIVKKNGNGIKKAYRRSSFLTCNISVDII